VGVQQFKKALPMRLAQASTLANQLRTPREADFDARNPVVLNHVITMIIGVLAMANN